MSMNFDKPMTDSQREFMKSLEGVVVDEKTAVFDKLLKEKRDQLEAFAQVNGAKLKPIDQALFEKYCEEAEEKDQ